MQINKEKNPEIACNIPAACLFVAKEPHPSPIALNKKYAKAVIHCKMKRRFDLTDAIRIPKERTTQAEQKAQREFSPKL